jgi:hypothetical protein
LNALKTFTCASCAERVRDSKRSNVPLDDINLELLRPAQTASDVSCAAPPTPFTNGPLEQVLVDPVSVFFDGNRATHLALSICPEALKTKSDQGETIARRPGLRRSPALRLIYLPSLDRPV